MTELKTLKDFKENIEVKATGKFTPKSGLPTFEFNGEEQYQLMTNEWIKKENLRQEAIKWIKELEKINKLECRRGEDDYCFDCEKIHSDWIKHEKHFSMMIDWEESSEFIGAIKMLKHFFNISEEELKSGKI